MKAFMTLCIFSSLIHPLSTNLEGSNFPVHQDAVPSSIPQNLQEKQDLQMFFLKHGYIWIKDFFSEDEVLK